MIHSLTDRLKHRLLMAEMALPDPVRLPYNTALNWGKTVASLGLYPYLSLYRLEMNETQDWPAVAYLGPGINLNFIAHLVCGHAAGPAPVARVSLLNINSTVRQLKAEYDLVIVELPYRILRLFSQRGGFLTMPYVKWQIDIQRSWEEIKRDFSRNVVRSLRAMGDIKCHRSHVMADFEEFYWEMYQPYIKLRHGDLAQPTSYVALRGYFERGWLSLYSQNNQIMGGTVQFIKDGTLYDYVLGMKRELDHQQRTRVSTAVYYYAIQTALEMECHTLDVGTTRPLLNDGTASHKRRWGAHVLKDSSQNWGSWIDIGCDPAKARRFLSQHLWIWIDKLGRPNGLVVVDDTENTLGAAEIRKTCKRFWIPGLHSIVIYANGGFEPDINLIQGPIPALASATEWSPDKEKSA